MTADEVSHDALLGGRVRLLQPRRGHRAGTDAVLLAELAQARPGEDVVDLGSASGAVGLIIAVRTPGVRVQLVERQPELAALARENVRLNGVSDRAAVVEADVFAPWSPDLVGSADLVVTNPPFFPPGGNVSPHPGRRAAHVMDGGELAGWIRSAGRLLRGRGRLCVIHRADALQLCISALSTGFGSLELVPVHPQPSADATRIVISAVKGGKAPTRLRPALVIHTQEGRFTPEMDGLHGTSRAPATDL